MRNHSPSFPFFSSLLPNTSPHTCRENCSFTDSHLTLESSATFTSCVFSKCEADYGGGLYTNQVDSTLQVTSCYFVNCHAEEDYGGGIATEYLANVYISFSSFINCHGRNKSDPNSGGGAVYLNTTYQCHQIHNCEFLQCYAGADGGAVHLRNCEVPDTDGFADTRFIACKTLYEVHNVEGGAVQSWIVAVTCYFSNCLVTNCHSYQGGGLFLQVKENYGTKIASFCLFSDNTASEYGNDLYFSGSLNEPLLHCLSLTRSNRIYPTNNDDNWLPQGYFYLLHLTDGDDSDTVVHC